MKIWFIPFGNWIYSAISWGLLIVGLIGFIFIFQSIIFFFTEGMKVGFSNIIDNILRLISIGLPMLLIGFGGFVLFHRNVMILPPYIFRSIEDINKKGFEVRKKKKVDIYLWKDIEQIELGGKKEMLIIRFFNGKKKQLEKSYSNWHKFLKLAPEELMSKGLKEYKIDVFNHSQPCKVCGKIAVKEKKCLSCSSETFNEELKEEFSTEEAYIKSEQLELFETDDAAEMVMLSWEDDTFETDKNWQPLVTEKEVLKHSKEYCWD